ncbi:MAG: LysR substrate-binding domain-containing protein [Acidobacteriota bacterium]
MELRLLKYFVTVAQELHFGRAAERLHISQPPLSQQIQQLENELGVELFMRTKRRVELTEPGRYFLAQAKAILAQTEQAMSQVRRVARGEIGQLKMGLVGSATYQDIIPAALRIFRQRYPEVAVTLFEMTSVQQLQALYARQLDIGFLRPSSQEKRLVFDSVIKEPLLVALSSNHPLASKREIKLKELATYPFIMVMRERGQGYYDQIIKLCRQAGFTPNVIQEAMELQTEITLISAGFGLSIVPASASNMRRKDVVYKPLKPRFRVELAAAYLRENSSPSLQAFLKILKEAVTPLTQ